MDTWNGGLTDLSIAELWQRLRGRSSSRVDEMHSLDSSTQGRIKRLLLPGSWTSIRSFTSSTYVQSALPGSRCSPPIQTELEINTHAMVAGAHRDVLTGQGTGGWVSPIFCPSRFN